MVNQIILDYLNRYSGKYKLEDLKNKIISKGYPIEAVNEAIRIFELKNRDEKKSSFNRDNFIKKTNEKKGFKWMKFAGIIGIIFLIIGILSSIVFIILPFFNLPGLDTSTLESIFSFSSPLFIIIFIVVMFFILLLPLATIFFYKGFSRMGKFCESKLLRFSSIVFIFLIILFIVLILAFILLFIIFGNTILNSLIDTGSTINIKGFDLNNLGYVLIRGVLLSVFFIFINSILFFFGLIKAGNKVKFAKIAGIFGLILFLVGIGLSMGLGLSSLLLTAITSSSFVPLFIFSILSSLWCLDLLFMILSLLDASRKFEG